MLDQPNSPKNPLNNDKMSAFFIPLLAGIKLDYNFFWLYVKQGNLPNMSATMREFGIYITLFL
jgi:hypothetical protein